MIRSTTTDTEKARFAALEAEEFRLYAVGRRIADGLYRRNVRMHGVPRVPIVASLEEDRRFRLSLSPMLVAARDCVDRRLDALHCEREDMRDAIRARARGAR